jgi:hypothetical protein
MEPSIQAILDSTTRPGDALADLRSHLDLQDIYREVAEKSGSLAEVNSSAQRHDNGFNKVVIGTSSRTGLKLVLHSWSLDQADDDDNIHNHRWDFASVVIRGMLCSEIYSLRPEGVSEVYSSFSYSSPAGWEKYSFRESGLVSASSQALLRFSVASTYSWGHEIFHRAYAEEAPSTATIVVQGPPAQTSTLVLLRGAYPTFSQQPVRKLSDGQVAEALEILRDPNAGKAWAHSA